MKIECKHCSYIYLLADSCPKCFKTGGFSQSPNEKNYGGRISLFLGQSITNAKDKKIYKIKELQDKGIIAILIKAKEAPLDNVIFYISCHEFRDYLF